MTVEQPSASEGRGTNTQQVGRRYAAPLPSQGRPEGSGLVLKASAGREAPVRPDAPESQAASAAEGWGEDVLEVRGAREHNLRGLDLVLPKEQLVVFTGPSGSGKSSLAFDTLFAEGQRRYVESLSAYARQFLGQMEKPDVDTIRGLSPTISIEQKSAGTNPRSTVGTLTEIYDYLRVLYARIGEQRCDACGEPIGAMTSDGIVEAIMGLEEGSKLMLMAPLARNRKGEYADLFADLLKEGFVRVKVDGEVLELVEGMKLVKNRRHTIDAIVDRLVVRPSARDRIADSVELALRVGDGACAVEVVGGPTRAFSTKRYCQGCDKAFSPLSPQSFSFNSPLGMCTTCNGLGVVQTMDVSKVIPDPSLSLREGAVEPWGKVRGSAAANDEARQTSSRSKRGSKDTKPTWTWEVILEACRVHEIDLDTPWEALGSAQREVLLRGSDTPLTVRWSRKTNKGVVETTFEGVLRTLGRRFQETSSASAREYYARYMSIQDCPDCDGARLNSASRAVQLSGQSIVGLSQMQVADVTAWFESLELEGSAATIGDELCREIVARLHFLLNVGLDYLSLNRSGPTLSGGEMQRIRLASQLGSELSGVMYVLDEPSIGLHPRDNARLIETLERLRDAGNTVIVVEHDAETMEAADWLVDFGPGAGRLGGEIVAQGTPAQVRANAESVTGQYLCGVKTIPYPEQRRTGREEAIVVHGATAHNLDDVTVAFPLGRFVCVTGVSGAGKSTLVNRILFPAASRAVYPQSIQTPLKHAKITGLEAIDKVIEIDQKPIGRTPRSNPATYTKVFDEIRKAFAGLPEAQMYGYTASRFSFNVKGGRCEACSGAGQKKIEMHFLADVYVPCEVCRGQRFNDATLKVTYKGCSIADVLAMSVDDACALFEAYPKIRRVLQTLVDVGLGYVRLGQPSPTLSGGEAQRIKLAKELSKLATGDTLYILDEPSTGLHFDDIRKLLGVVDRLVEAGNTVVMIEHNLDILKTADWIIDLGPEGGDGGGRVVAEGTPEQVAEVAESLTGRFLKQALGG